MEKTILIAMERTEKTNKVRNAGFIPGVLNGPGTASTSVKFDTLALNKIVSKHGTNAKIWIELGEEKKFGFMKEVQKDPAEGKIIHVAIQLVSVDQVVKMKLPISFHGNVELEHRLLKLQVYKSEIEVEGKTELMPDLIVVDVSQKADGENITAKDLNLPSTFNVLDSENEIYAVIKAVREVLAVESPEAKPAK